MLSEKIRFIFAYIIVFIIVGGTWQMLEMVEFGKLQPSVTDTVMGLIMTYFITVCLGR